MISDLARPYQRRAIDFIRDKGIAYLAVDMAMGKTFMALSAAAMSGKPIMVVGPISAITITWPAELQKWFPNLSYRILHGPSKTLKDIHKIDVILINYEGLPWFCKQTCKWVKRCIILDESQMVKNHDTTRFKILKQMHDMWVEPRVCLSATPATRSLHDLWSQYYLLDQGARLGKNISSFRATYCRAVSWPGQGFTEYRITQDAETQIPEKVADITFRLSVDDLLSLPPYMHNKIELDLPGKLRSTYDTLVNTGLFEYNTISFQCTNPAQQRNITRQFIQGGFYDKSKKWVNVNNAKISVLLEMLETINRNAIVTYQYRGELELICKEFKDASILSGTTPRAEVRNIIDKWNDGRIKALFVQVDIKLQGLNLQTGGSDIIWGALPWSLESFIQLSGRLRRPGQQADKVRMHYLLYKDTIDMRIYDALQAKQNVQNAVLSYFAANTKSFMEQEQ